MVKTIFRVNIKPHGKCRPRFGKGKVFKTNSDRIFESAIALGYRKIAKGAQMYLGPVKMAVKAVYAPSRAILKANGELKDGAFVPKISVPDADNILKAVKDGLNGIAYKDDSQVYSVSCEKYYGDSNYLLIEIERL